MKLNDYIIFLRVVVGLNETFFPGGMRITSLVLGFLPCLALRGLVLKDPRPEREITPPFFRVIWITLTRAFIALFESFCVNPETSATCSCFHFISIFQITVQFLFSKPEDV